MSDRIPKASRRRLRGTVQTEIQRLRRQARLLANLDYEVWSAGRVYFWTDYAMARWLVTPSDGLMRASPMTMLCSKNGRAKVLSLLRMHTGRGTP